MTTTPAQPEPPVLPPFDGTITPLIRSLARALNIESVDAAVGEGDLHLAARLAKHMAQPEPSEREVLDAKVERAHAEIARLCDGERWRMSIPADPKRDSDLILTDALDALEAALAARPAPVVSAEAVIEYVARVINDPKYGHDAEWLRLNLRASHLRRIAALGITVADTPAADDEGGQGR